MWMTPADPDSVFVKWLAPDPGKELRDSVGELTWKERWVFRLPSWVRQRLHKVRPVGPSGVVATRISVNSKHRQRQLATALSIVDPTLAEEAGATLPKS